MKYAKVVAIITGVIICASQISIVTSVVTKGSQTTGDLYNMAKIRDFKDDNQKIYQPMPMSSIQRAHVLIMGDSFSHTNVGYPRLAEQIAQNTHKAVYTYDLNDTKNSDDIINPLVFLKKEGFIADGKRRVFLLESVDRYMADRYENIAIEPSSNVSKQKKNSLLESIYQWTADFETFILARVKATEFFLTENAISAAFTEVINTARFHVYQDISPLTPVYSENPKALFYSQDVSFYQGQWTDAQINQIAGNISSIGKRLDKEYQMTLVFIPVPDKYVIYRTRQSKNNQADAAFIKLLKTLKDKHIATVDLYHPLISSTAFPYFPGDTHFNKIGDRIFVKHVLSVLDSEMR